MQVVAHKGQVSVAEVHVALKSLTNEVKSLPPLPISSGDAKRTFDARDGLLPFERLALQHFEEYPGHALTSDETTALVVRLEPFRFSKRELLRLLAHRPHTPTLLNICVDDFDALSEAQIAQIIETVAVPRQHDGNDDDNDNDNDNDDGNSDDAMHQRRR